MIGLHSNVQCCRDHRARRQDWRHCLPVLHREFDGTDSCGHVHLCPVVTVVMIDSANEQIFQFDDREICAGIYYRISWLSSTKHETIITGLRVLHLQNIVARTIGSYGILSALHEESHHYSTTFLSSESSQTDCRLSERQTCTRQYRRR